MSIITDNSVRPGEFLLSEGNGTISRDEIIIKANSGEILAGTVLGKITASGKHVPYGNAATDGSEVAVGILYATARNSDADQKAVIIEYAAEVATSKITGLDAAARVDLQSRGIKFR